jgi:predicted Zn-dependent peptidase
MKSSFSKKKTRGKRGQWETHGQRGPRNTQKKKREAKKVTKRGAKGKCEQKDAKKVCVKKYANHLSLIYEPSVSPELALSCICLFVNLGSAKEPDELRGVSHLIEHMMFKATKKSSEYKLLNIFDSTGARFNAYTNKILTCFYIICETAHMKACLDALAEMVTHAIFDTKETEKEQKIVHEENVQKENDPGSLLQDGIDVALFDATSYAKPVDYIHRPLNRKKVMEYYWKHYVPSNMALSIVSSASYAEVERMVHENPFSKYMPRGVISGAMGQQEKIGEKEVVEYHPHALFNRVKTPNGVEMVYYKKKGLSTVKIAVAFRTCPWKDIADREMLRLIKSVFARGLYGRLFVELRNKHGLAYSPTAGSEYYDKMGKFGIYTEIESSKLLEYREGGKRKKGVLPILFRLLSEFIEHGPTAKEWEDVKGFCHGEEMIAMENINHLADYNGRNYWLSLPEEMAVSEEGVIDSFRSDWETYLKTATLEECRKCIAKYFIPSNMCVVLVGSGLPSFFTLEKCIERHGGRNGRS